MHLKAKRAAFGGFAACDDCHLYVFRSVIGDNIIFIGGSLLWGCRIQRVRSDD